MAEIWWTNRTREAVTSLDGKSGWCPGSDVAFHLQPRLNGADEFSTRPAADPGYGRRNAEALQSAATAARKPTVEISIRKWGLLCRNIFPKVEKSDLAHKWSIWGNKYTNLN